MKNRKEKARKSDRVMLMESMLLMRVYLAKE